LKLYNHNQAFDVAADWNLDPEADYPISIACVPALCTETYDFSYRGDLDLAKYDLVLVSDIEMRSVESIETWAQHKQLKNYLVAVGSKHWHESLPPNYVYRPWWCYNFMRRNEYNDTSGVKPYVFDVLLGARRPHRDYVMLAFQHNRMLESSIVNYREFFQGAVFDQTSDKVAEQFANIIQFPYNSPNVKSEWEVQPNLDYSISSVAPWEIYRHTRYSIVCETLGTGGTFFMSEKTTKAMFAERMFVAVGAQNYLRGLRDLGFSTFDNIIDTSYDTIADDVDRYAKAFEQIKRLANMDYDFVLEQTQTQRVHNRRNLQTLKLCTENKQAALFKNAVESALVAT
jgi:hypothetical protein